MARYVFPDDRLSFRFFGERLYSGSAARVWVYLDQAATTPAAIRTYPGDALLVGSLLVVGADSLLPEFWGPDGVLVVWGRPEGSAEAYRIDSRLADRMLVPGPAGPPGPPGEAGPARPGGGTYVHVQNSPDDLTWTVVHNLGTRYPDITVIDSAGTEVVGDPAYLDDQTLTITFSAGFAGRAVIRA